MVHLSEQMAEIDRRHGLGGMAASLAHELSQPLTNLYLITDCLEMELQDKGNDTLAPFIHDLQRNAHKAGELVGRIRSFVGSENQHLARVEIRQVMLDAEHLARGWTLTDGVQLSVNPPQDKLFVQADAAQLVQILTNVLRNAMQATASQGTRRVDCRAWRTDATIYVAISDNGPGMTAELYRQVSSFFFSTLTQGFGLGLAIAQSLAKLNGGVWSWVNRPHKGPASNCNCRPSIDARDRMGVPPQPHTMALDPSLAGAILCPFQRRACRPCSAGKQISMAISEGRSQIQSSSFWGVQACTVLGRTL
jgi:C4-dicarboxylate-specific signal transduction histidine kinase